MAFEAGLGYCRVVTKIKFVNYFFHKYSISVNMSQALSYVVLHLMLGVLVSNINTDLEVIDLNIIGKSKSLVRLTNKHFFRERRAGLKWDNLGILMF